MKQRKKLPLLFLFLICPPWNSRSAPLNHHPARYADEIALDSEVVDEILRTGSNRSKGQLRLIYNFMVEKTPEEYAEFVKNEYGTGGKGFEIGGAKYAVWFDDLGIRIAAARLRAARLSMRFFRGRMSATVSMNCSGRASMRRRRFGCCTSAERLTGTRADVGLYGT